MSADPFAGYDRWLEKPYEAAEVCGNCGRDMDDHDGEESDACANAKPSDDRPDDGDRAYDAWKDNRYERDDYPDHMGPDA